MRRLRAACPTDAPDCQFRRVKLSGPDSSEYKERLLDAAVEIIAADGIEGLTATKLANRIGLRRTVVHYHFGTMDDLLAAIVRRSFAKIRKDIQSHFNSSTLGEDIWKQYTIAMPTAEAFRARSLASEVVGEAYREVVGDLNTLLSDMLQEAYRARCLTPEVPTNVMALILVMAAQFVGSNRFLGGISNIDAVEDFVKSLFAITANNDG